MKNHTAKSIAIFARFLLAACALTTHAAIVQTVQYGVGMNGLDYTDHPNWAVPFQFAGNRTQSGSRTDGTVANIPNPNRRVGGEHHCGEYSGMCTAFLAKNTGAWLAVDQADIMLLIIGFNDIGNRSNADATATELNMGNLVATVMSQIPNTSLIVAKITSYSSTTAAMRVNR